MFKVNHILNIFRNFYSVSFFNFGQKIVCYVHPSEQVPTQGQQKTH